MKNVQEIKIFLASPGDLKIERKIVFETIDELNSTICHHNNLTLKIIDWEKYTYPGLGDDGQDVINKQLDDDYDIFLCLFWKKIGTPTKRAKSGTVEELEIALQKYENGESIEIMLYFKNEPIEPDEIDASIFEVKKIKKQAQSLGLYKEFKTQQQFQTIFRTNLNHYLFKNHINKTSNTNDNLVTKHSNIQKLDILSKIDSIDLENIKSSNIIDSVEILKKHNGDYLKQLNFIGDIAEGFGKILRKNTNELNRTNGIKNERLKIKKLKENVKNASVDFDNISEQLEKRIPEFVITSEKVMKAYYDFYFATNREDNKDSDILINSTESIINNIGELILALNSLPNITPQFTTSKIRVIKNFRNIIDTIADGYYLLKSL